MGFIAGKGSPLPCLGSRRDLQGEHGRRARQGPAAPGPISVASISCPQNVLPTPLRYCQATGLGGNGGTSWRCPGWGVVHDRRILQCYAWHCLAPTVLTGPLLSAQRADLHFLRGAQRPPWGHQAHSCCAEEAVGSAQGWRTEPARPRQGQCAPHSQGLHGALWWREEARCQSVPQDPSPLRATLICGDGEWEGKVHASTYSNGSCLVRSSLPARRGRWPCDRGTLALTIEGQSNTKPPACPYHGTWAAAAAEAGSSSSSRSSMVAAWSSSGSIRMLALEARSSERNGRRALRPVEGRGVTEGTAKDRKRALAGWAGGLAGPHLPLCLHFTPPLTPPSPHCIPGALSCRHLVAGGIPITPSLSVPLLFPVTSSSLGSPTSPTAPLLPSLFCPINKRRSRAA